MSFDKKNLIIIIFLIFVTMSGLIYVNFRNSSKIYKSCNNKDIFKSITDIDDENINNGQKSFNIDDESINNDQKSDIINKNNIKEVEIIKVYITGAVVNPGVYSIEKNKRIVDLLDLAGGATDNADLENINLALFLEDESHIIVPKICSNELSNDNKINYKHEIDSKYKTNCKDKKISHIVNINTATLNELIELPGIGPSIAKNIIDYREKNGKFSNAEELKNVKRIGNVTFNKLKDNISVR